MVTLNPPTKHRSRPPILETITLTYVAEEDRIRLVGAGKDGDTASLWLTQRLCSQVVQNLTNSLEKLAEARGVLAKDAVLSLQQSAARRDLPRLPPVTAGLQAIPALVREIEVRRKGKHFALEFKSGKAACAEITFGVPQLHRWLSILHGRYVHAGWDMRCWPEWFERPDPKSAAVVTVFH